MEELVGRVSKLERCIKEYQKSRTDEIEESINSQFIIADSLIEYYKLPEDVLSRYNAIKMEYARLFNNQRIYYSLDRSNRIQKIRQNVEQIAEATEFLNAHVLHQQNTIDVLSSHMDRNLQAANSVNDELDRMMASRKKKMGFYRWIMILMAFFLLIVVFKIIF